MTPPVVVQISNDTCYGPRLNFGRAFAELAATDALRHLPVVPLAHLANGRTRALATIRQIIQEMRPDVLFVLSPSAFPWTDENVAQLLRAAGGPTVIMWEGDAWGGRKPLAPALKAWLRRADDVFTVGMGEQARLLGRFTRQPVRYIAQTVPQRLWDTGADPVPPPAEAAHDVMHIGSCFVRLGVLERLDGARERQRLVRALQQLPDCRFAVHGPGWRGPGALGPVPFDDQLGALRTARITANWDHFQGRPGYVSNRLPISLYAGRPHVTTRPPETDWLPGTEHGLHLVDSVDEAVDRVRTLLRGDPDELHTAGLAGHEWVRGRLTELNALRYMLSSHVNVAPPPADPWAAIGAMDALVPA
ncbi:hypothetical protein ACFQVC_16320 [Streptomyces monticola]|uniref:Spore protein YkvP/CgeB glycosyl transferase-like domain-containing protein n=1 Tax=Streptomyces monticola TaxID=2666263 RepID=A0ABW2JI48_9ACTN